MAETLYREFTLRSPGVWQTFLAFIKSNAEACIGKGSPLRLIVTTAERARTLPQNRRYWSDAVLGRIAESAWVRGRRYSKDSWHEYLANLYVPKIEIVTPDGEIVLRRKSTTEMTVAEFSEYMDRVQCYAATELGVEFDW